MSTGRAPYFKDIDIIKGAVMNMEITQMSDLLIALRKRLVGGPHLVSVDGVSGAGQKGIADALTKTFGAEQIEIGQTVDSKKIAADGAAKIKKSNVIVQGPIVQKALKAAGLEPDIKIYVVPSAKNSRRVFWEGILSKPLPVYLAELSDDFDKKTVEYHWQFHPIIHADYLVEG
jgi:hypothetical protein